jgi:hypothetical protein
MVACGSAAPVEPRVVVYDSAGTTIVVNAAQWPAPTSGISIDPMPLTAIETREGTDEIPFFRFGGATRLASGEIIVGDAAEVALRVFSGSGALLHRFSRSGRGPGELASIGGVTHWGDTVVVFDASRRIAALFDRDGHLIGERRLHTAARNIQNVHRLSDGAWVGRGYLLDGEPLPPESGYGRRSARLVLLDADGSENSTIGTFPDAYTYSMVTGRRGDYTFVEDRPVPFSPRLSFATDGEMVYVGTAEAYDVAVLNRLGRIVRIMRREWTPQEVTRRERDALAQRTVEGLSSVSADSSTAVEWVEAHARKHVPPYGRLMVDALGFLWVAEYPLVRHEPNWWSVYDPQGRLMGDVQVPLDLALVEIGAEYLLGVRRDHLGRESVYVHAIHRNLYFR